MGNHNQTLTKELSWCSFQDKMLYFAEGFSKILVWSLFGYLVVLKWMNVEITKKKK